MIQYKDFKKKNEVNIPDIIDIKNHKILLADIPDQIDYVFY